MPIAKERGLTDKDIDLGTLTKAAMIDRAVADAAFALKEGEVSAPVQGRFGTVLVRVIKIEPEKVRPFEDAADQLKTRSRRPSGPSPRSLTMSTTRSRTSARSDGRSSEAAEKLKLAARTVEVDRSGRDTVGRAGRQPAGAAAPVAAAFATEPASRTIRCRSKAATSGTRSPASRRRATARSTRSRTRSRRAGARTQIAKRLKTKAAEMLDKAQGRHVACGGRQRRRAQGRDQNRASSAATPGRRFSAARSRRSSGPPRTPRQPRSRSSPSSRSSSASPTSSCRRPTSTSEDAKQPARPRSTAPVTDDIFGEYIAQVESRGRRHDQSERATRKWSPGTHSATTIWSPSAMQIEPQASAFAKRYARGEAQVVWTTLVADLETPVSAFLKIAAGRPLSFLLGIGRGRRRARALFDHRTRTRPLSGAPSTGSPRSTGRRGAARHPSRLQRTAARRLARAHRRKPD